MKSAWALAELDALGQAALIQAGEASPRELAQAALERIDELDPVLGSVVWRMDDLDLQLERLAARPADGPLYGVPTLLKDIGAHYAGAPQRLGSRFIPPIVSDHDSELVARLRRAGLTMIGKSATSEFANAGETTLPGPTNNPWDLDRSTSGSSTGSAAAVAAGLVPIAHGSDSGGSIRLPAGWCGLFGLKPSRARNPMGPDGTEGCAGLSAAHMLTRSVRDSAASLDAAAGPDTGAPFLAPPAAGSYLAEVSRDPGRLRIGWTGAAPLGIQVDRECLDTVASTARLCADLGHIVEEARPAYDEELFFREFEYLTFDASVAGIEAWEQRLGRRATDADIEPLTWYLIERGRPRTASEHVNGVSRLRRAARDAAAFFGSYDVFLTPTNPTLPALHEEMTPAAGNVERVWEFELGGGCFTIPANVMGTPAMSVPLAWSDGGLPIGSHFTAAAGREDLLLRLAGQLEAARPWAQRWPPVTIPLLGEHSAQRL
jgi:amidase